MRIGFWNLILSSFSNLIKFESGFALDSQISFCPHCQTWLNLHEVLPWILKFHFICMFFSLLPWRTSWYVCFVDVNVYLHILIYIYIYAYVYVFVSSPILVSTNMFDTLFMHNPPNIMPLDSHACRTLMVFVHCSANFMCIGYFTDLDKGQGHENEKHVWK